MNSLTFNARLISAAIAAALTMSLLGTVVSLAEPQRSVLMARTQPLQTLPAKPVQMAMASTSVSKAGK